MHWRVQLKAVDPSASSPGDGWREIRHPVQGGGRYRTIYAEVFTYPRWCRCFFSSTALLWNVQHYFMSKEFKWHDIWPKKAIQRLQQMGSHLPLMTSHHNSDIPQLPTWSSKTPTFKNALRCLFGVPRNLNPKHTSIQAPSKIPSAGRFLWAALVIIGGDKFWEWQSFRSFFPQDFQVGNSNLQQCK